MIRALGRRGFLGSYLGPQTRLRIARGDEQRSTGGPDALTRHRFGCYRPLALSLLCTFVYVLLYLLPLGVRPLASPDEVRYGAIAHEMLVSGDFISPHFNGVRYFEKPVLGHWLNAASLYLLGETPFALRLPAALATGATALLVFLLARRFLTRSAAWLAAGIFLTTLLVAGTGTFAILDAYLALFLTAALSSYYFAIEADRPAARRVYLALCGAACAAAFLVKGFLGLAIPAIVVVPYLAAQRRWRTLWTTPWLPIAVAAVLILPWAAAIQLREPDFWHYFFWVEHVHRFAGADAQHAEPFWFYVPLLPLLAWPWIWLLPGALIGLRLRTTASHARAPDRPHALLSAHPLLSANEREAAFLWYAAAWAGLPLLFFSLAHGKLPSYLLPCCAPLAIVLAAGLESYLAAGRRRALVLGAGATAAVFVAILIALAGAQAEVFGEPVFAPSEHAALAVFAGCLALGAGCAIMAGFSRARFTCLAAMAGTGAALMMPLEVALPQRVLDHVAPIAFVASHAHADAATLVVSDASLFGTVAWALKRSDIYVMSPGEIEYGLEYPESRHRLLDAAGLERLLRTNRARNVLIVCKADTSQRIEPLLPPRALRARRGTVVVWNIPSHG
jgi:4-amino-4-deoxy-L-arabinose transferase